MPLNDNNDILRRDSIMDFVITIQHVNTYLLAKAIYIIGYDTLHRKCLFTVLGMRWSHKMWKTLEHIWNVNTVFWQIWHPWLHISNIGLSISLNKYIAKDDPVESTLLASNTHILAPTIEISDQTLSKSLLIDSINISLSISRAVYTFIHFKVSLVIRQFYKPFCRPHFQMFFLMEILQFRLIFHWKLVMRVKLAIDKHLLRRWLSAKQATSHCLNEWWLSSLTHICVIRP